MMAFPIKMVYEMIGILHNDKIDELGEIKYFIKSDYNPQEYGEPDKNIKVLTEVKRTALT